MYCSLHRLIFNTERTKKALRAQRIYNKIENN